MRDIRRKFDIFKSFQDFVSVLFSDDTQNKNDIVFNAIKYSERVGVQVNPQAIAGKFQSLDAFDLILERKRIVFKFDRLHNNLSLPIA